MRYAPTTTAASGRPDSARGVAGLLAVVAALVLAGCGGSTDTPPSPPAPSTIAFQWLPGGHDGDAVWLMAEDGRDRRRLVPGDVPENTEHADWSHDGERLAFEGVNATGTDLWIANADGSDAHRILDGSIGCGAVLCYLNYPAWSPDDRSIAYVRFSEAEDGATTGTVEVLDVESGDTRVVWAPPAKTLPNYPRWSPEGTSLVLEQIRYPSPVPELGKGLGSAISVLDVGDSGDEPAAPRVLTSWDTWGTYPDWSPDGETIVFTTYDLGEFEATDEPSNLFTIRPDGTDLTQLTRYPPGGKRATQPSWTPDGKRILFTLVGQNPEFDNPRRAAFLDADGSNLVVLPGSATHPRLRPGS